MPISGILRELALSVRARQARLVTSLSKNSWKQDCSELHIANGLQRLRNPKSYTRSILPLPKRLALLWLSLAGFSSAAFAQQGSFVPTGSMTQPRYSQSSTLLNNGKVLIAGGQSAVIGNSGTLFYSTPILLSSAELYDPATGTFTTTGSMTNARGGHTETLLSNGKVLVAGGDSAGTTAELFDPTAGTFTVTGSMALARTGASAVLLQNGKVLLLGGNATSTLTELYDPATGLFTATGRLTTARTGQTATLLSNGKVLVAGGTNGGSSLLSVELYDPAAGTFSLTASMTTARSGQTATLLQNGKVLVLAGDTTEASAEIYDPSTSTFAATGNLLLGRTGPTASLLHNGEVLVAGGFGIEPAFFDFLSEAELFDPTTGIFAATANLTSKRHNDAATVLSNGFVLVTGGDSYNINCQGGAPYQCGDNGITNAELYIPIAVLPGSLAFPDQVVSSSSTSQSVTLTNNSSAAVNVTSVAIGGTNASDFTQTNNCVGSVASGGSCTVNITFAPAAAGRSTASLTIVTSLAANGIAVSLSGTGDAATRTVSLAPGSLTFAGQVVGAASASQPLTVTNTGNAALTISDVSFSGANASDYAETDNCVGSLAPGAACTVNVTFKPTATGTRTATLAVADNAMSPASPQTVSITGTGQDFSLAAAASQSATVMPSQTASYTLTVGSTSGFNQAVNLTCSGAPAASTCNVSPASVTPSGSMPVTVTVTVATTASSLLVFDDLSRKPLSRLLRPQTLIALAFLGAILWFKVRKDQWQRGLRPVCAAVLLLCAGLTLSGCGGGSSSGGGSNPVQGTQAGTYTVVVSGTVTSGSTKVTHTFNLTLVVQ